MPSLVHDNPVPAPSPISPTLSAGDGSHFASAAIAWPLAVAEFAAAARCYPIVFTDCDDPMPVAVTGFRDGANLFVDMAGRWARGAYVPACARRPSSERNPCQQFETSAFVNALAVHGALARKQAVLKTAAGDRYTVDGFRIVDRRALLALPDDVIEAWRQSGWLHLAGLAYASQTRWQALLARSDQASARTARKLGSDDHA